MTAERERARRLMSATEFLAWDDGTDTRYELIDGVPVAMAPGGVNHAQIASNVHRLLDNAVRDRRPCRAVQGGGLRLQEGPPGRVYIPDVLMTCEPIEAKQRLRGGAAGRRGPLPLDRQLRQTRSSCRATRACPRSRRSGSSTSRVRLVHAWQRIDGRWQDGLPLIGRASFTSHVLGVEVSLDAVYALTSLESISPEEGAEEAGAEDADRDDGEQR